VALVATPTICSPNTPLEDVIALFKAKAADRGHYDP